MPDLIKKAVFDKVGVPIMQKALDMAALRHKLISGNLANVSTPKYKSKDIDFQGELKRAVGDKSHLAGALTHRSHIPLGKSKDREPEIIENKSNDDNGINNVNADVEVANMAQNQIYYSIAATLLQKKFEGLRTAIRSGE
jgi:flagellar basal-body rod protein FlgB